MARKILTLTLSSYVDGRNTLEQSFDFYKFPNLEEVRFGVRWMDGGLLWIPKALPTLKPVTSPRLSAIKLSFARSRTSFLYTEMVVTNAGNDLRRIADEVARIEREFEGAVELNVYRDQWFKAASHTLNV